MAEEPNNTDALRRKAKAVADIHTNAKEAYARRPGSSTFNSDTVVITLDPAQGATNPAGSAFGGDTYDLFKSEENLAPNFRTDRGLGQSSSNVEYTGAVPQPDFTGVGVGSSGVGGRGAINSNDQIGPAFGGGETRGTGGIGGDRAINSNDQIGPAFGGGETRGTGGIGGDRAITGPSEQIGPQFGSGETRGTGTIGGDAAITEGAPIGPDFSNPAGTGPGEEGGGGYTPQEVQQIQTPQIPVTAKAFTEDWRFRIGLMPGSEVLYRDGDEYSILNPLLKTDGVVFPYTPSVVTNYRANYDKISPTHSNYPTYFYQSSEVSDVQINATFTAQSTDEADYMMAVIHFFRSATKMFYGQDINRGTPPPLVSVTGFGPDQFNFHKAVISQFNYVLPENVDYIRTSVAGPNSINAQATRAQLSGGQGNFGIFGIGSRIGRLFGIGATPGAEAQFTAANEGTNLAKAGSTYVPTKIEVSLVLLPIVTRAEQSKKYSTKDYASGAGLSQRGHW